MILSPSYPLMLSKKNSVPLLKFVFSFVSMPARGKKHLTVAYEDESPTSSVSPEKKIKFVPKDWQNVLQNIRDMRKEQSAPVDTMGCEKCADVDADEPTKRFQILVALMLSSQTKDAITFAACQKLKSFGFSPKKLVDVAQDELEKLLMPVGFYKTKAKHIKATSQILIDEYNGDIPNTLEGLIKLPGVGPKMAHICMSCAWNVVSGIGVDTHVHRIANRLNWTSKRTADPEKTRLELESWIPVDLWREVNLMLVGFGQTVCLPKSPKCSECSCAKLCPSAFKESPVKKKSAKK